MRKKPGLKIARKRLRVLEGSEHFSRERIILPQRVSAAISAAIANADKLFIPGFDDETVYNKAFIAEHDVSENLRKIIRKQRKIECDFEFLQRSQVTYEWFSSENINNKTLKANFGEYELSIDGLMLCKNNTQISKHEDPSFIDQVVDVMSLKGLHWAIHAPNRKAHYWVAAIEGDIFFNNIHNLRLMDAEKDEPRGLGLYLQGAYSYCLLIDKNLLVIIPQDGEALDIEMLARDHVALSFVLGQRISIPTLVGFDAQGTICAERGGLSYRYPTESGFRFTPVTSIDTDGIPADRIIEDRTWMSPFFTRCSQMFQKDPAYRLDSALVAYTDSLSGDVIPSYLRVQVQLESLAYHLLNKENQTQAKASLVKSKSAWRKFVSATISKEKLLEFALDEKASQTIFTRIQRACDHASGDRVRDIFKHFKLDLCDCALEELEERDIIVHQMELSKERNGTLKVDREVARIKLVQTLLVALIALATGYRGKIRGWLRPFVIPADTEKSKSTEWLLGAWWKLDATDVLEAEKWYVARIAASHST